MLQYEKALGDDAGSLKLVSSIEMNAAHYIEILSRAVDKVMPEPSVDLRYARAHAMKALQLTSKQLQR
jgi:DNA replication licensing factor MCM7